MVVIVGDEVVGQLGKPRGGRKGPATPGLDLAPATSSASWSRSPSSRSPGFMTHDRPDAHDADGKDAPVIELFLAPACPRIAGGRGAECGLVGDAGSAEPQ